MSCVDGGGVSLTVGQTDQEGDRLDEAKRQLHAIDRSV
jgi:hypothetical protein